MRQVVQNLKTGLTEVAEVPCPTVRLRCVLVRTRSSLVSAGAERMLVEFGKVGMGQLLPDLRRGQGRPRKQ